MPSATVKGNGSATRQAGGRRSSRDSQTYEVAVALGSTLASTFLSEPPRMAAHAPRPVRPYTPRAMYSLALLVVDAASQ